MSIPKRIKVICEGKSDFRYIRRLQSFLENEMPYPEGWDSAPIKFTPCPAAVDQDEDAGGWHVGILTKWSQSIGQRRRHVLVLKK